MVDFFNSLYPYRVIFLYLACFSVLACVMLILYRCYISYNEKIEEKEHRYSSDELGNWKTDEHNEYDNKKALRQLAAADGINPNPLSYLVINDGGEDVYIRSFTIDKLPKRVVFAETFRTIFNFTGATTSVHICPMDEASATNCLDKHVVMLESERIIAAKDKDINRIRRLEGQQHETEKWAELIETGENSFYEVCFVISIYAKSLEELNLLSDTLHTKAVAKGYELSSCYGLQAEAYKANAPMNMCDGLIGIKQFKLLKNAGLKVHMMDKYSLASIYNHTQEDFYQKDGIILGRNLQGVKPITVNLYAKHRDGFNVIVAGKTGTGKSVTVKCIVNRLSDFGYRFVSIDSQKIGANGEYAPLAEGLGGVNFQIKVNAENVMNIFDINEELVEVSSGSIKREVRTLRLLEKITEATVTLKMLIQGNKKEASFENASYIEREITDAITDLYRERGIKDGDADSIYENGKLLINNTLTNGKVKKKMPTISDFYKKVLYKYAIEEDTDIKKALHLILTNMKDYVRELYYAKNSLVFFTKEQYEALPYLNGKNGTKIFKNENNECEPVVAIVGMRAYYDGQSNISINKDCQYTNIDLSQLPESEKWLARQIALSYVCENFIKNNSENIKKADRLICIMDEAHEQFVNENSRITVDRIFRTARKKNVSCILITQALADFKTWPETLSMLRNTALKFVFKQDEADREYLKTTLGLTDSQISKIISLGGNMKRVSNKVTASKKGEVCIIDDKKVAFCHVDYLDVRNGKVIEGIIAETNPEQLRKFNAMREAAYMKEA